FCFAKVVGTGTEVHTSLKLFEFFEIFDVSWHFVVRCEVISQRMIVALRGVMAGQAQVFFKLFHQSKINESTKILEHDLWAQVEVLPKIHEVVSLIISSVVEDAKALKVNLMASSSPEVDVSIWMNLSRPSACPNTSSSSGGTIPWPILSKSKMISPLLYNYNSSDSEDSDYFYNHHRNQLPAPPRFCFGIVGLRYLPIAQEVHLCTLITPPPPRAQSSLAPIKIACNINFGGDINIASPPPPIAQTSPIQEQSSSPHQY
ncbi:hypothetical protein PPACK8108_LOCUS19440, partial [Phakopsora pachyrhizi]